MKIRPLQDFCLRLPLLPFFSVKRLLDGTSVSHKQLIQMWHKPEIKESIRIASPGLYKHLSDKTDGELEKDERAIKTLLQYLMRMGTRCTPFGLFAGVSMGKVTNARSSMIPNSCSSNRVRVTRFDNEFLSILAKRISNSEEYRDEIRFYLNDTMYKVLDHYRYWRFSETERSSRAYSLEGIRSTEFINRLFDSCKTGRKRSLIINLLVDEGLSIEDASTFFEDLVTKNILCSEIDIGIYGANYLDFLAERLATKNFNTEIAENIEKCREFLDALDGSVVPSEIAYSKLYAKVKEMDLDFSKRSLLKVDSFLGAGANVCSKDVAKIKSVIEALLKVNKPKEPKNLIDFREDFKRRYGDKEVPLSIVLDPDIGIRYGEDNEMWLPNSFLKDVIGTDKTRVDRESDVSYTLSYQQVILRKLLLEAITRGEKVLQLPKDQFSNYTFSSQLPNSFYARIQYLQENGKSKILLLNAGGSCAANLYSRFAYALPECSNALRKAVEFDVPESSDFVYAETLHIPVVKAANVICRPDVRSYQIAYSCNTYEKSINQIYVSDLLVSVKGDTLFLRSKKLDKFILPRLTSAQNYNSGNLPVFNFLADLQFQNAHAHLSLHLGKAVDQMFFVPRIELDGVILRLARWKIAYEELEFNLDTGKEQLVERSQQWRQTNRIPQWVYLKDDKGNILLNLNNVTCLQIMLRLARRNELIEIEEYVPPSELIYKDQENTYQNEFVIGFRVER